MGPNDGHSALPGVYKRSRCRETNQQNSAPTSLALAQHVPPRCSPRALDDRCRFGTAGRHSYSGIPPQAAGVYSMSLCLFSARVISYADVADSAPNPAAARPPPSPSCSTRTGAGSTLPQAPPTATRATSGTPPSARTTPRARRYALAASSIISSSLMTCLSGLRP
jgi:hypothetical protein